MSLPRIFWFLGCLVASASAFEIGITDQDAKDGKAIVQAELLSGEVLAKRLRHYRLYEASPCPRAGFSAEEKKQALAEAKALLKELKQQRKKITDIPHEKRTVADYTIMGSNWKAIDQTSAVLVVFGDMSDVKWLSDELGDYLASSSIAYLFRRFNQKFSADLLADDVKWDVALRLAEVGDKAAIEHIMQGVESDSKKSELLAMYVMSIYNHEKAADYAKKCIALYQKELSEGKLPTQCYHSSGAAYWGLLHLLKKPEEHADYLASINGLVFSENTLSFTPFLMSLKDPKVYLDVMIGNKGIIPDWRKNQIARCKWHGRELYAMSYGRTTAEVDAIFQRYKSYAIPIALETRMVGNNVRANSIIGDQMMSNISSAIRLNPHAAELCQSYSDSIKTDFRYLDTPWIMMTWNPQVVIPHVGTDSKLGLTYQRISPFKHEVIVEEMKKNTEGDALAKRAILLWHKYINASFHSPERAMLGDKRVGIVRLSGEQSKVGVHTRFHVIPVVQKGKFRLGVRITSTHSDGGGLASAISQNHLTLQPLQDNAAKAQISNVRVELANGDILTLEHDKTTEGGVQMFSCDAPSEGFVGAYLRYDWKLLGEDVYPIVHPLYDRWSALVR